MTARDETLRDLALIDHANERAALAHRQRRTPYAGRFEVPYIAAAISAALHIAHDGNPPATAIRALAPSLNPAHGGNAEHLALEEALARFKNPAHRHHGDLIDSAAIAAATAHQNQVRKVHPIPYVAHPGAVALHLASSGFPTACVAAALVHDVIEDTPWTEAKLANALGPDHHRVLDLVRFSTEPDKSVSWHDRKRSIVTKLSGADTDPNARALVIADKAHNLRNIISTLRAQGPHAWNHFNSGQADQSWFAHALVNAIPDETGEPFRSFRATVRDAVRDGWLNPDTKTRTSATKSTASSRWATTRPPSQPQSPKQAGTRAKPSTGQHSR